MLDAVTCVTNLNDVAITAVGLNVEQDEWYLHAWTVNGETLYTVDSKKQVQQQEVKKDHVPVPK